MTLSYDVAIIQSINSCHTNHKTTLYNTWLLAHNIIMLPMTFSVEKQLTSTAIKYSLKVIWQTESYIRSHIIWNLWNLPKAHFINFIWNDHSCTILYLGHTYIKHSSRYCTFFSTEKYRYFSYFSTKNICWWYSLEAPCWDTFKGNIFRKIDILLSKKGLINW